MPTTPAAKKTTGSKTFEATLERAGDRLNWTIVSIPFDVQKTWGTRGQIKIKGEINGFAFRTSLFPTGNGRHFLMVNKAMQAGGRARPGASARIRIEPDTEERIVSIPPELERELRDDKDLRAYFKSLNPSTRADVARWVGEAKQAETRVRRASQIAERLYQTMEAERGDLPPVLRAAFQQFPKARAGWDKMPASHKRQHLLGIFYYRDPESQQRRVDKAVDMMIEYAEGRRGRNSDR